MSVVLICNDMFTPDDRPLVVSSWNGVGLMLLRSLAPSCATHSDESYQDNQKQADRGQERYKRSNFHAQRYNSRQAVKQC